jgi:hypothetical protein
MTNALDGLPVVQFNPTNGQYFNLPNLLNGTTGAEAFVVLKVAAVQFSGANRALWGFGGYYNDYPTTDGQIYEDFGSTTFYPMGYPPQPLDQYHVYEVAAQANNWSARINGELLGIVNNNTYFVKAAPTLGANVVSSQYYYYFGGNVAEVLVFDRALTAGERDAVGGYLNQRYNLVTNAPLAPAYVNASAVSSSQIALTWSPITNASEYLVERKTGTNGTYSQIATVQDAVKFFDSGLTPQTRYFYQISSANYAGASGLSGEVSATTYPIETDVPLSNLSLWLKADAQGWTNGTQMNKWPDISDGRNDATQPTASEQPTLVTNAANGEPIVRFNGVNDFFYLPNFLSGTTQGEMFVVLKAASDPPASNQSAMRLGPYGDEYPAADGTISEDFGTISARNLGHPLQPLNQYNVYNVQADSNWTARLNGTTLLASTNNQFAASGSPLLGSAAYPFAGDIAEIMVFNRTLTPGERTSVQNYLNQRYAVAMASPAAPQLSITASSTNYVTLAWPAITNATSYLVERALGTKGVFSVVATLPYGSETGYTDSNISSGIPYVYCVQAANIVGLSVPSNQVQQPVSNGGDTQSDYLYDYLSGVDPTIGSGGDNSVINLNLFTPLLK